MIWSQGGGLCGHLWVTLLIIPLVLLICYRVIITVQGDTTLVYIICCQNHKNGQKSISFFSWIGNRPVVPELLSFFAVTQTRRKLQKQSHFLYDLLLSYNLNNRSLKKWDCFCSFRLVWATTKTWAVLGPLSEFRFRKKTNWLLSIFVDLTS